jgi:hypothetical protein
MPAFVARKLTVLALLLGFPLAAHSAPAASSPETRRVTEAHQRYQRQKFGLFVHYVPTLTVDPKTNQPVQDIDELAKRFDVEQFTRDAADFGVEYVIFTVHHFSARMLYPSAVNKRWRDDCRKPGSTQERNWKTYSDTDVIAPLADALKKRNIDLHLYVHPVDGHDFSAEDQENTGWFECDSGHAKWNKFQNELFDELCKRYATRIQGLWFDGMFAHNGKNSWHGCIDQPKFRETLLKYNPALILTANVAGVRDKNPCADWVAADYRAWEVGEVTGEYGLLRVNPAAKPDNAFTWPGTKEQLALVVGGSWWASNKANNAKFSVTDMYLYLVLQASLSDSGGLAVSAGCFPGTLAEQPNGTLWEGDVRGKLVELNQRIVPVAESIKNTNASKAFVTEDHQRLEEKGWGVATDAPDGSATYLHVLRPPDSKKLAIGKPANGAEFQTASILPGGAPVSLQGDGSTGYTISLPDGISWNDLDTVIKLEVDAAAIRQSIVAELTKLKFRSASLPRHPQIEKARQAIREAGTLTTTTPIGELQSALGSIRQAVDLLEQVPPPAAQLNLALSKPVQASSTHPTTQAEVLTNGDRNSTAFWSSGDENAQVNYAETLTIDLGAEKLVGSVWLYPRKTGSRGGFPLDFNINGSTDGQSWKTLRSVKDADIPLSGNPRNFDLPATKVRYLQIQATRLRPMADDGNLYRMQLSGIEIFPPGN